MRGKFKPQSRKENIVVQELGGEILIYDLDTNKAYCLNETSALVWQACNGRRTIAEIDEFVGRRLNSSVGEDVVWFALDQLSREKLLLEKADLNGKFAGLSRREIIKKVGLASMVALPVVSSMVAPLAIHAASTCIAGGSCTCNAPSNGRQGQQCTPTAPCADSNCRCTWSNNGGGVGGTAGICVP